ncbi:MAG TPA: type II secretion system protein GspG [Desulfocapsa sulfexigens]|nr:type II secretion system protein GspG [Desulfocapsa sulfexigens]HIQ37685.1 type II secretion system protein GspG [Desulfocapsa sulfexigens]
MKQRNLKVSHNILLTLPSWISALVAGATHYFQSTSRKSYFLLQPFRSKALNSKGFTLIELLVVLVIIGILAGYVGPRIMGHPEEAKRTMAKAQISGMETALESYRLDNGTYPSTEQGLQALVEAPSTGKLPRKWREGGYMKKGKIPKDPWQNDYIYLSPGSHSDFDIISYGADGESGGEGDDADVNNWETE